MIAKQISSMTDSAKKFTLADYKFFAEQSDNHTSEIKASDCTHAIQSQCHLGVTASGQGFQDIKIVYLLAEVGWQKKTPHFDMGTSYSYSLLTLYYIMYSWLP